MAPRPPGLALRRRDGRREASPELPGRPARSRSCPGTRCMRGSCLRVGGGDGRGVHAVLYAHEADNTKLFPSLRPALASALRHRHRVRLRFLESTRSWEWGGWDGDREADLCGKSVGCSSRGQGSGWGSVCEQVWKCLCAWTRGDTGTYRHEGTCRRVDLQTAAAEVNAAHTRLQLYLHKAAESLYTCTHIHPLQGCLQTQTPTQSHTDRCRYRCSSTSTSIPDISL